MEGQSGDGSVFVILGRFQVAEVGSIEAGQPEIRPGGVGALEDGLVRRRPRQLRLGQIGSRAIEALQIETLAVRTLEVLSCIQNEDPFLACQLARRTSFVSGPMHQENNTTKHVRIRLNHV